MIMGTALTIPEPELPTADARATVPRLRPFSLKHDSFHFLNSRDGASSLMARSFIGLIDPPATDEWLRLDNVATAIAARTGAHPSGTMAGGRLTD